MSNDDLTPVWVGRTDFHDTVRALWRAGILDFRAESDANLYAADPAYREALVRAGHPAVTDLGGLTAEMVEQAPLGDPAPVIDLHTRQRLA